MKLAFTVPCGNKSSRDWSCNWADPAHNKSHDVRLTCENCSFEQIIPWEPWQTTLGCGSAKIIHNSHCKDDHVSLIVELIAEKLS